jgi:hypothetical protein
MFSHHPAITPYSTGSYFFIFSIYSTEMSSIIKIVMKKTTLFKDIYDIDARDENKNRYYTN